MLEAFKTSQQAKPTSTIQNPLKYEHGWQFINNIILKLF